MCVCKTFNGKKKTLNENALTQRKGAKNAREAPPAGNPCCGNDIVQWTPGLESYEINEVH